MVFSGTWTCWESYWKTYKSSLLIYNTHRFSGGPTVIVVVCLSRGKHSWAISENYELTKHLDALQGKNYLVARLSQD
jgi:hypothetical protein